MTYKISFLMGLLFLILGQSLLAMGNEFVYSLRPIDFAHWSLFVGVLFMTPQVVSFPKKVFSYVGIPLTLIGIACIIGMCVLDFIWWSFPDEETRIEFSRHISKVPSIWVPFITTGSSSKVFNLGLALLSLNFIREKKVGVIIILLATLILMSIIPMYFRLVVGYSLTFIGFSLLFLKKSRNNSIVENKIDMDF